MTKHQPKPKPNQLNPEKQQYIIIYFTMHIMICISETLAMKLIAFKPKMKKKKNKKMTFSCSPN